MILQLFPTALSKMGKIEKLKTSDLNFFLGKFFFGDDSFRNMFVNQQTLNTLDFKEDTGTECYWLEIKTSEYF